MQGGFLVRLTGIEPTHPAPEAGALSTELQAQTLYQLLYIMRMKNSRLTGEKVIDKIFARRRTARAAWHRAFAANRGQNGSNGKCIAI